MRPTDRVMAAGEKISAPDPKTGGMPLHEGATPLHEGAFWRSTRFEGYLETEGAREGGRGKSLYCGFCGKGWVS